MPREFRLEDYTREYGKLITYAWPGGYPIYYVLRTGEIACPKCAEEYKEEIVGADANWENPDLWCDNCSERIPSAYAEDEESD